ncbi:MAG: hypothetical protein HY660_18300 [Armatimonadetes bacterium]|nr:hypothetical protein [Armatimonadota bacterium]
MAGRGRARAIRAHIVLKGPGGSLASGRPVSAANVRDYAADPSVRGRVRSILEQHGFSVVRVAPFSIAVEGPRALFERVFRKKLRRMRPEASGELFWSWSEPPEIPAELSDAVDTVVFPQPVQPLP